jgi:hypothetical protein
MWNEETDILDALDEYNLESESTGDFSDLEFDSDIAESPEEYEFDEDNEDFD